RAASRPELIAGSMKLRIMQMMNMTISNSMSEKPARTRLERRIAALLASACCPARHSITVRLDQLAVGPVGQAAEDGPVDPCTEIPHRAVAEQEVGAARVIAAEAPDEPRRLVRLGAGSGLRLGLLLERLADARRHPGPDRRGVDGR